MHVGVTDRHRENVTAGAARLPPRALAVMEPSRALDSSESAMRLMKTSHLRVQIGSLPRTDGRTYKVDLLAPGSFPRGPHRALLWCQSYLFFFF